MGNEQAGRSKRKGAKQGGAINDEGARNKEGVAQNGRM